MVKPFDNILEKEKEKLLKSFEAHMYHFSKNSDIFTVLKPENSIGIVISGDVQILQTDYNGNRILIDEIQDDELFGGFLSFIRSNEYEIIAKEDTDLIVIDYDQIFLPFDSSKKYYYQFLQNILEIVVQKMNEKNERIEILTKKTIRNKLLAYFQIASNKYGSKYVYLPFNFIDLADYLAIDRSAMSRELKNLKEEGFIEVKGKRITLLYENSNYKSVKSRL